MVPIVVAVSAWQTCLATEYLDLAITEIRSTSTFQCEIIYTCTRTPIGVETPSGTTDSAQFAYWSDGQTYSVTPFENLGSKFVGDRNSSTNDPYQVFDHRLVWLLGFRDRPLGFGATGQSSQVMSFSFAYPTYLYVKVGEWKLDRPSSMVTYVIDRESNRLLSINTISTVGSSGSSYKVLFTESVAIVREPSGPRPKPSKPGNTAPWPV